MRAEQRSDGIVRNQFKARVAAGEYSQVEGVDYSNVFAPVANLDSICIMLLLVASFVLYLLQRDVATAFFYCELQKKVYIEQPEGFISDGKKHLV